MPFWGQIEFFNPAEFDCSHCGENHMKHSFMLSLDALRKQCAFPFPVTSGYRCPAHNNKVSSTGLNGPHTTGQAVDIGVYGEKALMVVALAGRHGFLGLGISQKSSTPHHQRFIHLDTLEAESGRPRPWIWTY